MIPIRICKSTGLHRVEVTQAALPAVLDRIQRLKDCYWIQIGCLTHTDTAFMMRGVSYPPSIQARKH